MARKASVPLLQCTVTISWQVQASFHSGSLPQLAPVCHVPFLPLWPQSAHRQLLAVTDKTANRSFTANHPLDSSLPNLHLSKLALWIAYYKQSLAPHGHSLDPCLFPSICCRVPFPLRGKPIQKGRVEVRAYILNGTPTNPTVRVNKLLC